MSDTENRFQVNLRGIIDLLSHHLYSSPDVFLRELLQNSVDALQARRQLDADHVGSIQVELMSGGDSPPTIVFTDNGIGLTLAEVHQFLATIGESSKRGEHVARPTDFLGRFGIGLLSCFMVSDRIVVITRSARDNAEPVEWRGNADGTYSIRTLEGDVAFGTQVFLRANDNSLELFDADRLIDLLRRYGAYLEPDVQFISNDVSESTNDVPPWDLVGDAQHEEELLAYASEAFGQSFLDLVPLNTDAGDIRGVAFVMANASHAGSRQQHRVYLRNILLSESAENLFPDWTFFIRSVVNTRGLTPTASRESFVEDTALEIARDELGACLRDYLVRLGRTDPNRLQRILAIHHLPLKALALEDEECLSIFADWFPFDTSLGRMTLGEFRRENPTIRYAGTLDQFRQIAQVAASESLAVINAGYVYDAELLERIGQVFPDIDVKAFEVEELSDQFEPLTIDEQEAMIDFERLADVVLQPFKCSAEMSKFRPAELPALYVSNKESDFQRSVEQSQDEADDMWKGILDGISEEVAPMAYARLHLNIRNTLVRRLSQLSDRETQQHCLQMLYVQSLLLGHFPLGAKETHLLTDGLLGLIDRVMDKQGESS